VIVQRASRGAASTRFLLTARRVESVFGVRFLYSCADGRKVLGVSHRKGFWMG
jgi:hypothetical protein